MRLPGGLYAVSTGALAERYAFAAMLNQKADEGWDMLFFFPFAALPVAAPTSSEPVQHWPLPMLPAPSDARQMRASGSGFESAISQAGQLTVDWLKQALSSLTVSMTALGNQANAYFAQIVAALAFDRVARDAASFFGMVWPAFEEPLRQMRFAGLWAAPVQGPSLYSPFGLPGWSARPAANPWALFADAAKMWWSFWLTAAAPKRPAQSWAAPFTTNVAVPGSAWSFAFAH